jgi:hypothetical protein
MTIFPKFILVIFLKGADFTSSKILKGVNYWLITLSIELIV